MLAILSMSANVSLTILIAFCLSSGFIISSISSELYSSIIYNEYICKYLTLSINDLVNTHPDFSKTLPS